MAVGDNVFQVEVEALDPTMGYKLTGMMIINGARTQINEHYSTEAAARARLGTGFDVWAAQVDAE